ncbi:hypothetical protein DOO78_01380 [Roseicella frigidaeris]|uniref:Phasin domain-containing protein n=1 Tax=Roseicella frigidaeris TaxID=2230885 RepID=A0A327MKX1_9PROT|nr:hypothetical protein DOO78_01380 [Roseicella frigidaeris]
MRRAGQAAEAMADGAPKADAVVAEAVRTVVEQQVEAARQGGALASEALERAAEAGSEGVTIAAASGRQAAEALREGTERMTQALPQPAEATAALQEMPRAIAGLFNDTLRLQLRIGQELLRLADPVGMIAAQQQLLRSGFDAFLAGQEAFLRAAQQMTLPGRPRD